MKYDVKAGLCTHKPTQSVCIYTHAKTHVCMINVHECNKSTFTFRLHTAGVRDLKEERSEGKVGLSKRKFRTDRVNKFENGL